MTERLTPRPYMVEYPNIEGFYTRIFKNPLLDNDLPLQDTATEIVRAATKQTNYLCFQTQIESGCAGVIIPPNHKYPPNTDGPGKFLPIERLVALELSRGVKVHDSVTILSGILKQYFLELGITEFGITSFFQWHLHSTPVYEEQRLAHLMPPKPIKEMFYHVGILERPRETSKSNPNLLLTTYPVMSTHSFE